MKISRLRRALAVFLSAAVMIMCMPFAAITASAASLNVSDLYIGNTTKLNIGDSLYQDAGMSFYTVYIYYAWKDHTYANLSDWQSDPAVAQQVFYDGDTITISSSVSSSNGAITAASYWSVAGKDEQYNDLYIYVKSDKNKPGYTLTFNSNDSSNTTTSKTGVTSYTISASDSPTRTGFTFLGWAESQAATTAQYTVGSQVTLTANKTLYAVWEHTAHDWEYSASGNVITANCTETDCKYNTTGATITLNATNDVYSVSGYTRASVTKSDAVLPDGAYSFASADGTTYPESPNAPANVGSYKVYYTLGSATAEKEFTITAAAMSGFTADNVTETYDGINSCGIEVTTGTPSDAVIKYGEAADSCTMENSPEYINAGTYTVYYEVTKDNYTTVTGSATVTIEKADYDAYGEYTAEAVKGILAGEVNENLTVELPEIPDNMSYGTITYSSPVTSAFISVGVLTFSTDNTAVDLQDYTITVPVIEADGAKANYNNYDITVTLKAKTCTHPDVSDEWSSDENGHWYDCPDCSKKVDYADHTEETDEAVAPTCTETGLTEGKHCSVCEKVIVEQQVVDALGHDYDEDGICSRCGEVRPSVEAANNIDLALDNLKPTNNTAKDDVKAIVDENKGGTEAEVTTFELTPATEETAGSLKVVITVSDGENTETVTKEYVIDKLPSSSTENEAAQAAEEIDSALDELKPSNYTTEEDVQKIVDENKGGTEAEVTTFELTPATEDTEGSLKVVITVSDGTNTENVTKIYVIPALGAGNIKVETEDNIGGASADGEEVKNAVEITEEEQALIDAGYDLHIILNVQNADSTVSAEDKALTESTLTDGMTVGMYLDITLLKKIGELETAIHTTNAPITITFEMPESLINKDENVTRKYFIIRVHEGVTDIIECTFDPETGKASFMTDKFSSYAIAYRDDDIIDEITDAEEAAAAVEAALDDFDADNNTSAEDILAAAENAAGGDVTVEVTSIVIIPATENVEGTITVTLTITDNDGNTETVEKVIFIEKIPQSEPEKTVYYPVITSGDVVADKSYAAAGQTVNVIAGFGYDIIVTAANGRQIAKLTEKGSFTMPASKVYVKAVQNETVALMATAWRNSYVYSYDADMNRIKVNSTQKRGVIVVNLGEEYAGKSFTIYSGRKSTKVKITDGVLDENGKFVFEVPDGKNYTLVIED